ncbi:MAG: hypothetical protein ACRDI1_02015 [Actinomycetota bacterium]
MSRRTRWIAGVLILAAAAGIGIYAYTTREGSQAVNRPGASATDAAQSGEEKEVAEFDEATLPLDRELGDIGLEMRQAAEQFEAGTLSGQDVVSMADDWEQRLREVLGQFNRLDPPDSLQEARALFAYGTSTFISAVEPMRLAARSADEAARTPALQLMKQLQVNTFDVVNMAKRELEQEKQRLRLGSDLTRGLFIQEPIPLPPASPSPAP